MTFKVSWSLCNCIFALACICCSEKRPNEKADLKKESEVERGNRRVVGEDVDLRMMRGKDNVSAESHLPEALVGKFGRLRQGAPKLPIYVQIATELRTPAMNRVSLVEDALLVLNEDKEVDIVAQLRAGEPIGEIDNKTAISYMSLLTGWILDEDAKLDLYLIFRDRATSDEIDAGDVMLATIIRNLPGVVASSEKISDRQMEGWVELANCDNPLVRQIAAYTFPRLVSDPDKYRGFVLNYGKEKRIQIVETLLRNMTRMPASMREKVVVELIRKQSEAGNLEVADYLRRKVTIFD